MDKLFEIINTHQKPIYAIMAFVLYVLCFVSLYTPNLELIGFGLFFVLHVIMSLGIIKSMTSYSSTSPTTVGSSNSQINIKFINIRNVVSITNKLWGIFWNIWNYPLSSGSQILKGLYTVVLCFVMFIIGLILFVAFCMTLAVYICSLPFQLPILFGWSGIIEVSWVIIFELIMLFVAFIMMLITFANLRTKHFLVGSPIKPEFLPGGFSVEKSGYKFIKKGSRGEGYYNTENASLLYFNNGKSLKQKDDFKIISITITVLIWVQYYISKILPIPNNSFINGANLITGITAIILSCVCVWLAQKIGVRSGTIQDTPDYLKQSKKQRDHTNAYYKNQRNQIDQQYKNQKNQMSQQQDKPIKDREYYKKSPPPGNSI